MNPDRATALLALLQLNDSLFPSGAFTHSYGLEQLAREGIVRTPADVERFVAATLAGSLATADAVTALRAFIAARENDLEAVIAADRALLRTKLAAELRAAALSVGRRLLAETSAHVEAPLLTAYEARVRADRELGVHAAVFGAVCSSLGVEAEDVVPACLLGTATALLQASMRLLPVSHRDVQSILHRLRPRIAALAQSTVTTSPPRSFAPLQDVASMRHARAEARLFSS